jgi:polysaccharide biosynthesis/export protein
MPIAQLKELAGMRFSMPSSKAIRALLLSLFATSSLAQTATTGAIAGRVMDTDGAAVPNVNLTFTSVNLIGAGSATSGKDGVFRISNIPPGRYRVSASREGGRITFEAKTVDVNISRTSALFILVTWPREIRSTTERGRQSLKLSWAQPNTNSQESKPSNFSFSGSKAPDKPKSTLTSAENEAEARKYYNLAINYERTRLFKDAVIAFTQAIRLKSNYADAYYGLGLSYFELGKWKEAIDAMEQAINIDPKTINSYAKQDDSYARQRVADKAVGNDRAASRATVGMSVSSSAPDSVDEVLKPATSAVKLTQIYRVGIGDVLDVRLSKAPSDRSTLFTVTPYGVLEHPILTQPLKVEGLTPEEITVRIKAELKSLAIDKNPVVLVGVREYASHTILVSGLVKDPGTKFLRREALPLYVVLADAQPLAEAGCVTIVSKETGASTTVELSDSKALSLVVQPGDVINVQATPQQFLYIGGEVKAPGEKPFRRGLTLTQAILAAGGLSRKAKDVQVAREGTNGRLVVARYKLEEINSGRLPDPLIQPGDRITVVR